MKKLILFAVTFMITFGFTNSVNALEINKDTDKLIGVSENIPSSLNGGISAYGTSKPSNVWSWSQGNYAMSGATSFTNLYTDYMFSSVTSLKVVFTKADESITIELWKSPTIGFDSKVGTKTISRLTAGDITNGLTRTATFSGLSTDTKYYLKIIAPAHFSATVKP